MTLPYNPTTVNGMGLLVPIFKALHHVHNITVAIGQNFPMTIEVARSELTHAIAHLDDINPLTEGVLSTSTWTSLQSWRTDIGAMRETLQTLEAANPDAPLPEVVGERREELKDFEKQSWTLLTLLDIELMGWRPDQTDAGTAP